MRRAAIAALMVLAGCGGPHDTLTDGSGPHPPATADERLLADRYREFVADLDTDDVRRYRLPRQFDLSRELFAVADPYYDSDEIQISAELLGRKGGRLIVFFRRAGEGWRVKDVMVGFYG